ncbi:hypothetical protein NONO_c49220 [Nocardia nova SH22a]|uniref:Uncharacterized protein n=1 Tax=Nocardia nova SH22a TaxID=1415166 RepID=W5TR29_9NOCA|nr:hypothetical protein [Nocardia nova]AHH19706.1 hypothetical protein NONO_c49220 [Nocardia nova SH22a]
MDDVWTGRYLQRHDGSWWVVGEDGWSTSVEDLLAVRDGLASMVRDLPHVECEPLEVEES